METEQNTEESKNELKVEELVFGFALNFEKQPNAKELCEAIISVAQNISVAALQKEAIGKAVAGAKENETKRIGVRGQLTKEGIEVTISPFKVKSIITPASASDLENMSRQQRRAALRSLK